MIKFTRIIIDGRNFIIEDIGNTKLPKHKSTVAIMPLLDKWCEKNCKEIYHVHIEDFTCAIYFESEEEAIAFKLKWL